MLARKNGRSGGTHAPGRPQARVGALAEFCLALTLGWPRPARRRPGPVPGSTRRCWPPPRRKDRSSVYTSTNEQEGLPLFKIFEDATGIKVHYVRAGDGMLVSRMADRVARRPAARSISCSRTPPTSCRRRCWRNTNRRKRKNLIPTARDPRPALVRRLRQLQLAGLQHQDGQGVGSAEELRGVRAAQGVGRQGCDRRHRQRVAQGLLRALRRAKATQIVKDIVGTLKPVITDGHLALARSVGCRRILAVAQQLRDAVEQREARRRRRSRSSRSIRWCCSIASVAVNAKSKHPNAARLAANFMLSHDGQGHLAKFGRLPTRGDVQSNPPGILDRLHAKKVVPTSVPVRG